MAGASAAASLPVIPAALVARLRKAHRLAALTGAGISAESGVDRKSVV
jgi:hypothetical protein